MVSDVDGYRSRCKRRVFVALKVTVEVEKQLEVERPYKDVFEYLADVPQSASNFPNVDKLIDMGKNAYRSASFADRARSSLPALTKIIVAPLVVREFSSLVTKYLKNLKKALQG